MLDRNFPTYLELKQFIEAKQKATICTIRDLFNQKGEDTIYNSQNQVLAYSINSEFFMYLKTFIEQDYVVCRSDIIACLLQDSTEYDGQENFVPIVLSIREQQ
jgi:hypothetical protein